MQRKNERTVGIARVVSALAIGEAAIRSGTVATGVALLRGRWWWWRWWCRLDRFRGVCLCVGSSQAGADKEADDSEILGEVHLDGLRK